MGFGIVMFIAGVQLGEYVQYKQSNLDLEWYGENCVCRSREFIDPRGSDVSDNKYFTTNNNNSLYRDC